MIPYRGAATHFRRDAWRITTRGRRSVCQLHGTHQFASPPPHSNTSTPPAGTMYEIHLTQHPLRPRLARSKTQQAMAIEVLCGLRGF